MEFWQGFAPPQAEAGPWRHDFPAGMPDGSRLRLPLRDFSDFAVAGLIANQASFSVVRQLAAWMAEAARPLGAEVVVGLPTLGHVFGPLVAEALGHPNWVAPGYSRKRWYEEALSVPMASITTPTERRMWLDPRMLPRLTGRRVLLVDDVISTGSSARAGLALMAAAGVTPVALCVAMAQGDRWGASWPVTVPVVAAFATPIFQPAPDGAQGWVPCPGSLPLDCCPLLRAKDFCA
jgi:adenine/guanine phosphoribosyltransferase-like PRPP-binding protein